MIVLKFCFISLHRIMFTVSDESFTSDPVFVTLDIVLANDNAPIVTASLLDEVSHAALYLHPLLNGESGDCSRILFDISSLFTYQRTLRLLHILLHWHGYM